MTTGCTSGACPGRWGCRLSFCPCKCHQEDKRPPKKIPEIVAKPRSVLTDYWDARLLEIIKGHES